MASADPLFRSMPSTPHHPSRHTFRHGHTTTHARRRPTRLRLPPSVPLRPTRLALRARQALRQGLLAPTPVARRPPAIAGAMLCRRSLRLRGHEQSLPHRPPLRPQCLPNLERRRGRPPMDRGVSAEAARRPTRSDGRGRPGLASQRPRSHRSRAAYSRLAVPLHEAPADYAAHLRHDGLFKRLFFM